MEQSDSIKELASALAKAQAEMKAAEMTATNPFLKNKYADLGEVIKASRPALTKHGLSVIQPVSSMENSVIVTTQLMHESGEWIKETMVFPLAEAKGKSQVQEAGSIITYLRRYSLASMIGIYADDDTDGGQPSKPANGNGRAHQEPVKVEPPAEPPAPVEQEAPVRAKQVTLNRWSDLREQAMAIGLTVETIPGDITENDLIAKGKALKARIIEAEKAAGL